VTADVGEIPDIDRSIRKVSGRHISGCLDTAEHKLNGVTSKFALTSSLLGLDGMKLSVLAKNGLMESHLAKSH
jgi:hypothetical protein